MADTPPGQPHHPRHQKRIFTQKKFHPKNFHRKKKFHRKKICTEKNFHPKNFCPKKFSPNKFSHKKFSPKEFWPQKFSPKKNFTKKVFTLKIFTQKIQYNFHLKYSISRLSFVHLRWAQLYESLVIFPFPRSPAAKLQRVVRLAVPAVGHFVHFLLHCFNKALYRAVKLPRNQEIYKCKKMIENMT